LAAEALRQLGDKRATLLKLTRLPLLKKRALYMLELEKQKSEILEMLDETIKS